MISIDSYNVIDWGTFGDEHFLLKKERTGLPVDIFVDDSRSWVRKGINNAIWFHTEEIPFDFKFAAMSVSDEPEILSTDTEIFLSGNQIYQIKEFVKTNKVLLERVGIADIDSIEFMQKMIPIKKKQYLYFETGTTLLEMRVPMNESKATPPYIELKYKASDKIVGKVFLNSELPPQKKSDVQCEPEGCLDEKEKQSFVKWANKNFKLSNHTSNANFPENNWVGAILMWKSLRAKQMD